MAQELERITPDEYMELLQRVQTELARRDGNGSLVEYADIAFANGPIEADKFITTDEINTLIQGLSYINPNGLPSKVTNGQYIKATQINAVRARLEANEAQLRSAISGNDCAALCSGMCVTVCTTTCSTTCTGTCKTECTNTCLDTCTGGCKDTCLDSCTGGCKTGCKGGCTGGCSGCSGNCEGGCKSCTGCSGSCTKLCTGCGELCSDTCKNTCKGGCYTSCSGTLSAQGSSGNNTNEVM